METSLIGTEAGGTAHLWFDLMLLLSAPIETGFAARYKPGFCVQNKMVDPAQFYTIQMMRLSSNFEKVACGISGWFAPFRREKEQPGNNRRIEIK
ncbi:MAG TPA: hypothetical protein VN281_01320 [Verrucomicrobiae bacterium]|jgi:hypothetical protein|nr:hypothetical protein [Verrucomicrobiae bacterium]